MKKKSKRRQHDAPTIADVARLAGVSQMTVSRVINGEGNVREQTGERVRAAIQTLGYVPNKAARNLAGVHTIHIGLLYGNPSAAYLSEFLVGAMDQARIRDIQLVVEKSGDSDAAIEATRRLIAGGIDGILLPPPLSDSSPVLRLLEETDTPTVVVGSGRTLNSVSVVSINDRKAASRMTEHLLKAGHRRIGFVVGDKDQAASELRLAGFRDALQQARIEARDDYIVQGDFSYRSGLKAATALLNLPEPPTAIFASNDDMAAATVAIAHQKGLDVPGRLTVVGFDDTAIATTIWPELTTIHQPINNMSRAAVDLLAQKIRARRANEQEESRHVMLDFTFIKRESDAAPEKKHGPGGSCEAGQLGN